MLVFFLLSLGQIRLLFLRRSVALDPVAIAAVIVALVVEEITCGLLAIGATSSPFLSRCVCTVTDIAAARGPFALLPLLHTREPLLLDEEELSADDSGFFRIKMILHCI